MLKERDRMSNWSFHLLAQRVYKRRGAQDITIKLFLLLVPFCGAFSFSYAAIANRH